MNEGHYGRLLLMTVLSFAAMYVLMYAMVNVRANIHPNLNQFYMAGLMAAAMVIIELAVMHHMYPGKRGNIILLVVSGVLAAGFFMAIRRQTAISDRQFLKSMIPHHAGAILMCQEATLQGTEVKELCRGIVASQQSEIKQMGSLLDRPGTAVKPPQDEANDSGRVVDEVYAAYNSRNLEKFLSLFADDVVIYRPPQTLWLSGAAAVRDWYASRFQASPRASGTSLNRIVHGRYVVDQDHVTGSSTGPDRTVVWIYEIENGRIVRAWVLP